MKTIKSQDMNLADTPTFVVSLALTYAQEHGAAPERILAGSGLNLDDITNAGILISFRQATTIVKRVVRLLPTEAVGLSIGAKGALGSLGILGLAMLSSGNIREAINIGLTHHKGAGSLINFSLEADDTEFSIILHERFPDPELLPFLCEEALSSILGLLRIARGERTIPRRIELSYAEPSYAEAYQHFFNCPVHFGQRTSRIVLDAALLDTQLTTASPAILASSLKASTQLLPAVEPVSDLATSVESVLRGNLRQRPTMECVANALNITERTLRRGLKATGKSFSSIRDRLLEQQARVLLDKPGLSIAAISAELGFSDAREFRRAFHRWTGETPSRLRKEPSDTDTDVTSGAK